MRGLLGERSTTVKIGDNSSVTVALRKLLHENSVGEMDNYIYIDIRCSISKTIKNSCAYGVTMKATKPVIM